jgi:hypothetical protein
VTRSLFNVTCSTLSAPASEKTLSHSVRKSFVDVLSIGVDRIQRNFEPMKKQVEAWKATRIPDEAAKLVIYGAFVEGELDVPKYLARRVHDLYFNPLRSAKRNGFNAECIVTQSLLLTGRARLSL